MGWNNQAVELIILEEAVTGFSGLFGYSPKLGAGNLVFSVAAKSGKDRFGNAYLPGEVTYFSQNPGEWFALANQGAFLTWYQATSAAGPWTPAAEIDFGPLSTGSGLLAAHAAFAFGGFSGGPLTEVAILPPSGDTSGVTDLANINELLGAGPVVLLPGTYYVDGPVIVPEGTALLGPGRSLAIPTGNYGAGGVPLTGAIISATAGFAGSGIVELPTPSPNTNQSGGQFLSGLTIDGGSLPATNTIHGIYAAGYIAGVTLQNVTVWGGYNQSGPGTGLGGDGLHKDNDGNLSHVPDFWQVSRCKFSDCGGYGISDAGLADCWYTDTEGTGNHTGGWLLKNGSEARLTGCRADSNTGNGFNWQGLSGFTGKITQTACAANSNSGFGWAVSGAGTGTILLNGCQSSATSNTLGAWSYAGSNGVESNAALNTSSAAPTFW